MSAARAILYADVMTDSMTRAIGETDRRRTIQQAYNAEHGITPASIVKVIDEVHRSVYDRDYLTVPVEHDPREAFRTEGELRAAVAREEAAMKAAAADLDFERAATLRDKVRRLRNLLPGAAGSVGVADA